MQINFTRIVELSHVLSEEMPHWPGDPRTRFETVASRERDGFQLRSIAYGEHSGTHVNASHSFVERGNSLDDLLAERFIAPIATIHVKLEVQENEDYLLSERSITRWESEFGAVPAESFVFVNTGWSRRWEESERYLNRREDGMHFPGLSREAAELLVERRVGCVGIDTHGIDGGASGGFEINTLFAANGILVAENLTNLDQLPPKGATGVLGFAKVRGATGAPASILALI